MPRPLVRRLIPILALVLLPVSVPPGHAAAAPASECRAEAPAETDALSVARACRERVEVVSRRSERSQTFANPDGSLTSVISPVPQRVRRGAHWRDIDTTLQRGPDGGVTARAVVEPIVLSAGGDAALLSFGRPGRRYSLYWPGGPLPEPVLDGNSATYAEVMPGIDLRVEVEAESYRQLLVVKTREAAGNPGLGRVSFRVQSDGLSLRKRSDGRVEAVDGRSSVVYASTTATMWDSPAPAVSPRELALGKVTKARAAALEKERAAQAGEPSPHRIETMPVDVAGGHLSVSPLRQMLDAPDTVYPVTIDPAFSKPSPMWYTNVMDDSPNRSYYGEYSEMRVGRQWGTSNVWRAHVQFDTTELKGSTITSAELSVTADHTASCGSTSIQLWQTQYVSSPGSYTWYNDSDGDWVARVDTKTFSANESSCPKGDDTNVFAGTLKTKLQAGASNNSNRFAVGLRAANESDDYQWTRFLGNKTFLTATYNRKPNKPTGQAISDCYLNCTNNPLIGRKDPELSVFATDPDPATILAVYFEVQTSAGAVVATGVKTGYATGPTNPAQPAKWRVTPALNNGNYRWRARSKDEQGVYSDYTGWFAFSTDSTAPAVPTVKPADAALYFEDDGSGACSGGIGVQATFNLSAETSVLQFTWALDGGAFSAPITAAGTGPKTAVITVKPQKDMLRVLRVRAYDGAGRFGEARYEFRVCSPSPEAGHWKLDGNANDDVDLVTKPHHGTLSGTVSWPQGRLLPETAAEYTMSSGPRTFIPASDPVALTGDDELAKISLPFAMPFYGGSYNEAWISTNGALTFAEPSDPWWLNGPIPEPTEFNLALYPFWTTLELDAASSVRTATVGTAPNRTFVVEWRNAGFEEDLTARVTFQAQISEDGAITFAYADILDGDELETGTYATVGIENGTGNRAVTYSYEEPTLSSGNGVTFTPTGVLTPPYPEGYYEARLSGGGGFSTGVPVLATGLHPETGERRSFAVAAWVRVTDTSANRTAVSQQGTARTIFELGYQSVDKKYCFSMAAGDSTSAAVSRVCATSPVVAGEWVHLAAVYDGPTGVMKLYAHYRDTSGFIDPARTEVKTLAFTSVWDSTGSFAIGRGFASSGWGRPTVSAAFIGDIDEVWAWQRVPEDVEIEFLALT
ncbi:LamG domain-containing protein [Micromonospora maritima]